MSVLGLKYYGDPILRKKCRPVEKITPKIRQIAEDLIDTVSVHNGSGLAAPQIGYDYRMFVCCLSDEVDEEGYPFDGDPKIFINPEITPCSEKKKTFQEGCLSIPSMFEKVPRWAKIDVRAMDLNGNIFEEKGLCNWRSANIQHETDHLDGILYIDRLPKERQKELEGILASIQMKFQMKSFQSGQSL